MTIPGGMPPAFRDLVGYGRTPPDPRWPDGARLALSFVVNVEEGAELSIASGDERNEGVPETRQLVEGHPDPCMETHFAYGARVALWRVMDLLDSYGVKATFSCCGRAVAATPALAAAPAAGGHEVSAHGWRWESHAGMAEATERAVIARTVAVLAEQAGARPVGWHTKSAASVNTRRLLVEEGGFLYDSDAYDDDLPRLVAVAGRPHVVLPYAFDTNDMRFAPGQGFVQPTDFSDYCIGAFDWLMREARTSPKMMSVGLHLRTIGRPGRIRGLELLLDYVTRQPGVWIARRRDIATHWRALSGLPA
ncbi:polysaccharide deacetylase family protein [Siccirubricoccus sp. KC 17139]|uniref:Chitooligosaccharide deacetylase n=1 Tax=Siccirubricoccus soli TaxID=2899147 RepID=A0ABT1D4L3_9PROT|nr:polysaccharide deacetylase family protein [Siccirubricoccus soli]MCO6416862.1 polysaccharide deacetylase family protein [Siccirubricoccus soli]MCP2682997.1 polysaccharide deacetylase family protein [Siccirubricoccus soli]